MTNHPKINRVDHVWLNEKDIPKPQEGTKSIYAIVMAGGKIGIGETNDIKKRVTGGYVNKTKTMKYDGSTVIAEMQKIALENGNYLKFGVICLQSCDSKEARIVEGQWIEALREPYHVLNRSHAVKTKNKVPVYPSPLCGVKLESAKALIDLYMSGHK